MEPDDRLPSHDDAVMLRAENSELMTQNIKLEREVSALQEQLAALRAELEGRTVGQAVEAATKDVDARAAAITAPPGPPSTSHQPAAVATPAAGGPPSPASTTTTTTTFPTPPLPPPRAPPLHGLSRGQAERYSRHLLLPAFGVAAQERLCGGSVLVVGCGGLGSPVAMYLAAAGVGRLGLVDHDTVDVTNLHRQVLHATSRVGMHKALSGRLTCAALNPTIQIEAHICGFTPATALPLTDSYDVVVDASDNPATRYLVSDACVVSGKPLVSAAAVGTDGQLTVYHYGEDGPCYRCLFPESPAPENCSRCGEAGVLGVVPGIMGCLQALEAIKILAGVGDVSSKKMTIFDALAGRFTNVRLRGRNPSCPACGSNPAITRASLPAYDYVLFTGQPPDDGPPEDLQLIDPWVRLAPEQVARLLREEEQEVLKQEGRKEEARHAEEQGDNGGRGGGAAGGTAVAAAAAARGQARTLFLDVRPQAQYDVMALPGVVHVPYEKLEQRLPEVLEMLGGTVSGAADPAAPPPAAAASGRDAGDAAAAAPAAAAGGRLEGGAGEGAGARPRVVVLCRRGNNSQRVVARLAAAGVAGVTDMVGGYAAWARQVDPDMPLL